MESILKGIEDFIVYIESILMSIPILKNLSILFLNKMQLGLVFLGSFIFIAVANQLKNFSPSAKERPLPYRYRLIINSASQMRYLLLALFAYYLILNTGYMYLGNLKYFMGQRDHWMYLKEYIALLVEGFILITAVRVKFDAIPFLKATIDRTVIQKLNAISIAYQSRYTKRTVYHPDGVERITQNFIPLPYFQNDTLCHGLDENKKPVYTDFTGSMDGHFTIIGGSGMGKGVLTRMYLYQTFQKNITNIIFDPKPDDFMFDACVEFAKRNNKGIYVVDMDNPIPQISLFKSVTSNQFRSIMTSALELQKLKTTNARIWANRTEMALHNIAQQVYQENITPSEIRQAFTDSPDLVKDSEDTINLFTFLDDYQIFNTKSGLNLKEIIESEDVLYIRCAKAKSNDIARQQAQILFTALFEHINTRNHHTATQCVVVIDEFKFIMNTAIMDNLATIRSQKCSLIFNFQDISNFTTSPNEALRNPAYAKELLSNSHMIAIHNANDIELIRLIQQRVGKKTYHKPFEDDKSNTGGTGETSASRRWARHTEFVLTENEISTGGKRTAILLSPLLPGKMARIHTDIIPTSRQKFSSNMYAEPFALTVEKTDNLEKIIIPKNQYTEITPEIKKTEIKEDVPEETVEIQENNDVEKETESAVVTLDY